MEKIIQKECRAQATHINGEPRNFDKEIAAEELEKEIRRDKEEQLKQRSPSISPSRNNAMYLQDSNSL